MELNRLRELAGILQVNEAKSSKTPKTPMEILNALAKTIFGKFGFATLKVPQMATLVNIEKADKIAKERGEFGIASCSEDLMKEIFNENPSLLIGDAAKMLGKVNEAKSSKTPMEILNDLAKTIFGAFGFATLKVPQMATLVNIEKADKIAKDNRETGIATCSEDLMKEIFNENPSLLIGKAAKKLGAK